MSILPLKKVSNIFAPVLSCLVSASLHHGKFPQKFKIAIVIPLHKVGHVLKFQTIDLSHFSHVSQKSYLTLNTDFGLGIAPNMLYWKPKTISTRH